MKDTVATEVQLVPAENRPAERKRGAFVPGKSGNPGGRPKELAAVQRAARKHGIEAIATLYELMNSGPAKVRAMCAMALLDRGFGKPATTLDAGSGGVRAAIGVIILPPEGNHEG